ncbi:MAG: DUF3817 domain-containing protein [Saprospiraceae bacterium]|nr:DUF3817 domain-containing protein [Saprospiraceae bacterium]
METTKLSGRLLQTLRVTAILEGISYLLFAVTVPLKYIYNITEPNFIVGTAHGFLFILYVLAVGWCALRFRWSFRNTFLSGLASLVPFGTFIMDQRFFRKEMMRIKE